MRAFALAATAVAGLLCTASTADAQYRYRSRVVYSYPTQTYPIPDGVTSVGTYVPLRGTSIFVPSSSSSYYTPTYVYSTSDGVYYMAPYSNRYIVPSNGMWRGRGWRW